MFGRSKKSTDPETKDIENEDGKVKKTRPLRIKFIRNGAIAGIIGTLIVAFAPAAIEKTVKATLKIDPSLPNYMFWEKVPLPLTTKFYIFNIENPEEFLKGARLRVREIGPFVLEQWRWKEVIGFTEKTVKYYEWRNYTILPEKSVGSWDQQILIINPLVAGVGGLIGDKIEQLIPIPLAVSPFVFSVTSALLLAHSQNFFLKTTPRGLIVGTRVNLLDTVSTLVKPLEPLGIKAGDLIPLDDLPNNTFGVLNGKNYSRIGPWEVYTGVGVPSEMFTQIVSFKGERMMKKWAGPLCNTPRGTDGLQFAPYLNRSTVLHVFAAEVYRWVRLIYKEDLDFFGIPVYKYVLDPALFEPPSVNPENACWCVHSEKRKYRCEHYGMLDLTGGFAGSPFVLTRPHFLNAPDLLRDVDGVSPNPDIHEFYLGIHPDLGMPLVGKGRLQFNLRVEKVPFLRGFSNIRNTVIPLAWVEEGAELNGPLFYLLKGGLVLAPSVAQVGLYGAAIGGWAAFIGGLTYVALRRRKIFISSKAKTGIS